MIDKASIGNKREALEQVMAINEMIFLRACASLSIFEKCMLKNVDILFKCDVSKKRINTTCMVKLQFCSTIFRKYNESFAAYLLVVRGFKIGLNNFGTL